MHYKKIEKQRKRRELEKILQQLLRLEEVFRNQKTLFVKGGVGLLLITLVLSSTRTYCSGEAIETHKKLANIFEETMVSLETEQIEVSKFSELAKIREVEKKEAEEELARQRARAIAEEQAKAHEKAMAEKKAKKKKKTKLQRQKRAQKKQFEPLLAEEFFFAQIIEIEAMKSWEDRVYVGSVILNRVRTTYEDFRNVNNIWEVFYQEGKQYNDDSKKMMKEGIEPSPEALEVAHGLLTGEILCLEEKILFQTSTKKDWMWGRLGDANLPGVHQYYGYPLDFEERCL